VFIYFVVDAFTFVTALATHPQMTAGSLVYTNLLIYTPAPAEDGLIRMEEAVIPIECHYERSVSLLVCSHVTCVAWYRPTL